MSEEDTIRQLERQLAELDHPSDRAGHQKIDILNELAWMLFYHDNQQDSEIQAREFSESAFTLAGSSQDGNPPYQAGLAYSLRTQGHLNMRSGDYSAGFEQLLEALRIFESLHLVDGLADVYDGMASIHFFVGDHSQALDMAYKQLAAAQQIGDQRRIANANNNLASIFFAMDDRRRAFDLLNLNLKIAKEVEYGRMECATLVKLQQVFLDTGEDQPSLENGLRGLQKCRELGHPVFEVRALRLLALYYARIKDEARALSLLEQALDVSKKLDSKTTELLVLLTMGEVYHDLNHSQQAEQALQQAVMIAKSVNANHYLSQAHLLLSELYEQRQDSIKALHHFKQHYAMKMLIAGEKSDQRVDLLKVLHEVETIKKEANNARMSTAELRNNLIDKEMAQEQLQRQLDYEQALAHCSNTLLMFGDSLEDRVKILHQALEHLRIGIHASRACLFRNIQDPDSHIWLETYAVACAPGIHPFLDHSKNQKVPWTQMPETIFNALQAGKLIGGPVEKLFVDQTGILGMDRSQERPLLSVLFFPIYILDQWWGFMAFEDDAIARQWDDGETVMIETASGMIASALRRWQAKDKAALQLNYARALSACSQILMSQAENKKAYHDLLAQAMQHLIEPSRAGSIKLLENIDDPSMGFSSRVVSRTFASESLLEKEIQENLPKYRETFLGRSTKERSKPPQSQVDNVIVPWSLFPDEIPRQLANGSPIGLSRKDLQESNPLLVEYLSNVVHIKSIHFFPIIFNDHWWGTLSLDDRVGRGPWDADELLLLHAATQIIKNSLQRRQAQLELRALNDQLEQNVAARTAELRDTVEKLRKEVAERQRAERSLQETMDSLELYLVARTNELATFFDLILMAGQGVALDEIFEFVALQVMEVTQSHATSIDVLESDGEHMHLIGQANIPEQAPWRVKISEFPPEIRRWMSGPHDPLLISDLDKEIPSFAAVFDFSTYKSLLIAQIKVGDRIEGMLGCYRNEKGGYGVDVVSLVTAVAHLLGQILEIDHLRQQARSVAVLEERQRLARDLHDSVTQSLYSLTLFSRAGREAAEDGDRDRLITSLNELEVNTLQILREMRLLLYELRPASLQDEGLVQALESRFDGVERRSGLALDIRMDEFTGLSSSDEVELYNVVIETMNNVIKHANATHVRLELVHAEDHILLRVVDNGRGFDPSQGKGGMGITNIKERITRLNGQISISSTPGNGTQVEAQVPYRKEANA